LSSSDGWDRYNKFLYVAKKESTIGRRNNKGKRLIIMHAISPHGPLAEREELTNLPVSNLVWKSDSCHLHPSQDGKITCETIWKATAKSGDYHENMNSNMFMKWVKEKLLPTFERLHPGKKMVLILDNAPYHHKRMIGNLSNKAKQELVDICNEHNIKSIDVEWNNHQIEAYSNYNVDKDMVKREDATIRLTFDEEEFMKTPNNQPAFCSDGK
jgi:hypothetical protein